MNTKHLLRSWAVVVIFGSLVLVGITFEMLVALRRGEYTPVFAVAAGFALATLSILWSRRKNLLLFRESTPDRAIAFYHASLKRAQNGKALAAYHSALASVLYGQFDRAREELASVNWATLPPIYQGYETYAHSLLAIFEGKDYLRALHLAEEARDLCVAPERFPGVKTSRVALDANVAVCELLSGKNGPELLSQLDKACRELPRIGPAIPAWALAIYHVKAGQLAEAHRYLAIVKRLLPHGVLLLDPRLSTLVRAG